MVKEIIKDESVLSMPCEKATIDDAGIIEDLKDTIASMEDAVCLAANQIGETKQIGVYLDENDEMHVIFNPILRKALHPEKMIEECFSREEPTKVTRFECINVIYDELIDGNLVSKKQEFHGRDSQVIQHLIDHCKGKLV